MTRPLFLGPAKSKAGPAHPGACNSPKSTGGNYVGGELPDLADMRAEREARGLLHLVVGVLLFWGVVTGGLVAVFWAASKRGMGF